jgi:hypothetical protein
MHNFGCLIKYNSSIYNVIHDKGLVVVIIIIIIIIYTHKININIFYYYIALQNIHSYYYFGKNII